MAQVKWIKVYTDMFDDDKLKLIDTLPERDTIYYIWMRLLLQAGKTNDNGDIYLTEDIQYTEEMLSIIFNRPIEAIRLALKTLKDFGLIDVNDCNVIKISSWKTNQNVEGMERLKKTARKRVSDHQKRKQERKKVKENIIEEENLDEDYNDEITYNTVIATKLDDRLKNIDIDEYNNAIAEYGEERVTMAIDRALDANKLSMKYVNGILRNWVREGFPKKNTSYFNRNKQREKPWKLKMREPRRLTDEEMERALAELI